MSKSLWSIMVLGFITIIIMVIMMLFSLSAYQRSPAANRAKFSNMIRERFQFPEVGAEVKAIGAKLVLRVDYVSTLDSNFNDDLMKDELERVATFTRQRYDGKDRNGIDQLRLRRTEIQGGGCWSRTLEREMTVDKPFRPVAPAPEEDPEDN